MDYLWEPFAEFLADLGPQQVQVFVGYLLESCPFQIDKQLNLVNFLRFERLLAAFELVSPGVFHFLDDPFRDVLRVRALEKLHQLDLASIYDQNGPPLLVCLVETHGHELSDRVLFAHEVMLQQQVNLHLLPPSGVFNDGL